MPLRRLVALLAAIAWFGAAQAQAPSGFLPPAVGVVRATRQAVTETSEFIGRIQAVDRVALTARVTAFLEQRLFTEGTEVSRVTFSIGWSARRSRPRWRSRKPPSPTPALASRTPIFNWPVRSRC